MQPLQGPQKGADVAVSLIGLSVLLVPCAVMDVWKKRLPVVALCILMAVAATVNLVMERLSWWEILLGVLYGGSFLLISLLSKGAVGLGDGVMIAAAGAWMGIMFVLYASIFGFLLAGIFGLLYIKVKKLDRKTKLPFAPFFTASCLLLSVLEMVSGG